MLKQASNDAQWKKIWDECVVKYPIEHIIQKSEKTKEIIAKNYDSQTVIGYSGGKDSLVLRKLCEECIPNPKFLCCIHENEYPSFESWLTATAPPITFYCYDHTLSLEFLNEHLSYLFPHDEKEKRAFAGNGRTPCFNWMKTHGYIKIICGKRWDDGNTCGRINALGCRQTELMKPHIISLNPIADWVHDEILAYIRHFDIELPRVYTYPNGFRFGTHAWTERRRLNLCYKDTFDEIMTIEPEIVFNAAKRLDVARLYLEGRLTI